MTATTARLHMFVLGVQGTTIAPGMTIAEDRAARRTGSSGKGRGAIAPFLRRGKTEEKHPMHTEIVSR